MLAVWTTVEARGSAWATGRANFYPGKVALRGAPKPMPTLASCAQVCISAPVGFILASTLAAALLFKTVSVGVVDASVTSSVERPVQDCSRLHNRMRVVIDFGYFFRATFRKPPTRLIPDQLGTPVTGVDWFPRKPVSRIGVVKVFGSFLQRRLA